MAPYGKIQKLDYRRVIRDRNDVIITEYAFCFTRKGNETFVDFGVFCSCGKIHVKETGKSKRNVKDGENSAVGETLALARAIVKFNGAFPENAANAEAVLYEFARHIGGSKKFSRAIASMALMLA